MKTKTHWYCSSCTKEFDGNQSDCQIEFFINEDTKEEEEYQGQTKCYKRIEYIGVCFECCYKAMGVLGMNKTIQDLNQKIASTKTI